MNFEQIVMVLAAAVPAIVLLVFVYKKDKTEKEPISLILLLLAAGAFVCLPATVLEHIISVPLDSLLGVFSYVKDDVTYVSNPVFYLYQFLDNFIRVALVEEGVKWIALYLITSKNKNFDSFFDGVIYAVCVSLGFALFENIKYVFTFGIGAAVVRAVTAVPGHMFFGVIMGMYYTQWNVFRKASRIEQKLKKADNIPAVKLSDTKSYLILSILIPTLAHGFYDFCSSIGTALFKIAFVVFLIILYVFCFKKINMLSKSDANADTLAVALFMEYHPELQPIYDMYIKK